MTTKEALSEAMRLAAGNCNRLRSLQSLSNEIPEAQFMRLAGQHPDTLERDINYASQDFQRLKLAYESHCTAIGEPAYATYNED